MLVSARMTRPVTVAVKCKKTQRQILKLGNITVCQKSLKKQSIDKDPCCSNWKETDRTHHPVPGEEPS